MLISAAQDSNDEVEEENEVDHQEYDRINYPKVVNDLILLALGVKYFHLGEIKGTKSRLEPVNCSIFKSLESL